MSGRDHQVSTRHQRNRHNFLHAVTWNEYRPNLDPIFNRRISICSISWKVPRLSICTDYRFFRPPLIVPHEFLKQVAARPPPTNPVHQIAYELLATPCGAALFLVARQMQLKVEIKEFAFPYTLKRQWVSKPPKTAKALLISLKCYRSLNTEPEFKARQYVQRFVSIADLTLWLLTEISQWLWFFII